jgi:hypothetical protein
LIRYSLSFRSNSLFRIGVYSIDADKWTREPNQIMLMEFPPISALQVNSKPIMRVSNMDENENENR